MRNPWCEMFQAYAPAIPNAGAGPGEYRGRRMGAGAPHPMAGTVRSDGLFL
jgi:hypothetical protein